MKKKISEKQIQNAILDYLALLPGTYWACNNTGIYDNNRKAYRKPSKHFRHGVSDILGITNDGTFVAIEVKTSKGRVSEHQKRFLIDVLSNNGIAFVARSVEDVRKKFEEIRKAKS